LTSFFKNVFNKLTNKQQKEIEERKRREIEAINQWKKNEEKRAELREKLKNENLNNEEINYVDKIQNIPEGIKITTYQPTNIKFEYENKLYRVEIYIEEPAENTKAKNDKEKIQTRRKRDHIYKNKRNRS
jgi:hypothetical protein